MRCFALVLVLLFTVSMAAPANAFDGDRAGFIIGGGLGGGINSFTQSILGIDTPRTSNVSLVTDFQIGAGITDQFLLYWMARSLAFSDENIFGDQVVFASGLSGIGATYFPQKHSGFYVKGGLGLATWGTPLEKDNDTWTGFGILAAVGQEFKQHWSVELGLSYGSPSNAVATTKATSVQFSINGLAY